MTEHGEIVARTVDVTLEGTGRDLLRRRLAITNPQAFPTEGSQEIYEAVLAQMLRESSAVPGFGTMQDLAIEVYAFLWSRHHVAWSREPEDDAQLGPEDRAAMMDSMMDSYDKLIGRFSSLFSMMTKARTEAALEDSWKRDFINTVFYAVEDSLSGVVEDQQTRTEILSAVLDQMRRVLRGE